MRLWIFLLLLPLIASAKFGTEIELVGLRHRAAVACNLGIGAGALVGIAGGAAWAFTDWEGAEETAAAGAMTAVGCGLRLKHAGSVNKKYLQLLEARLRERPDAPRIEHVLNNRLKEDALEITYPNGAKILFTQDPNVIEVKTILADLADARAKQEFLEREIYELGRAVGLRAPKRDGIWNGGHIHIDLGDAFGRDPRKLKRFVLDFWAHPELQEGLLARDHFNARPVAIADPAVRAEIDKFAAAMDRLSTEGKLLGEDELFHFYRDYRELFGPQKAIYINPRIGTLEIRGLRSQRSGVDLARVIQLIDGQIRYTNGQPDRSFTEILAAKGATPRGRAGMTESFARWVGRTDLDYDEMKLVAPARFRRGVGPCEGFFGWVVGR